MFRGPESVFGAVAMMLPEQPPLPAIQLIVENDSDEGIRFPLFESWKNFTISEDFIDPFYKKCYVPGKLSLMVTTDSPGGYKNILYTLGASPLDVGRITYEILEDRNGIFDRHGLPEMNYMVIAGGKREVNNSFTFLDKPEPKFEKLLKVPDEENVLISNCDFLLDMFTGVEFSFHPNTITRLRFYSEHAFY